MESPVSRLEAARGEIAKAWVMRVVERSSLEDLQRLPLHRVAQELPELAFVQSPCIVQSLLALAP